MLELRPYQREDAEFIKLHKCCGVFNEQRTGKTPTVLTALNEQSVKKIIIVCPATVIPQWKEEFERWTGRPCIAVLGKTPSARMKQIEQWTDGIAVSYETFKSTVKRTGIYAELLIRNPEAIIVDEAHRIKNHKSQAFKTLNSCTKIPIRIALTGTPAPNKAYEIFGILHFLFPKTFPSYWNFIDNFFTKVTKFGKGSRTYIDIGGFQAGKKEKLQKFLNENCTQRKRKDVMQWLPDKDYQQIRLEPTPKLEKYLYELMKYFEIKQANIVTQGILDRLIRVRQLCLDPALLGLPEGDSPKTDWIKHYAEDYPDTPTIIFSKSKMYLKKLMQTIFNGDENTVIITGDVPVETRTLIKTAFQEGKVKRLLLQVDAGKEGLTLDKAETIIFTDKYPPAGDILQAEDRFVATTEDKANKPHTIIELMIKGTYDEHLYKLVRDRLSETEVINNFKKYLEEVQ